MYRSYSRQVQFDEWQDVKMCSILINDDSIYEGPETFYVELTSPTYALLDGVTTAAVTITDEEDGEMKPVLCVELRLRREKDNIVYTYMSLCRQTNN